MVSNQKSVVVAMTLCVSLALSQQAAADPNYPILWNRLGSQWQIEHSNIGLNGTYLGGSFVPGPAWWDSNPDNFAYSANYDQDWLVTFPKEVVPWQSGCIEFWAKLSGFSGNIPDGEQPYFLDIGDGYSWYRIGLNGNDGAGNGGLCGGAGHGFACGTGSFANPWTYGGVLGAGQEEDWHHYALVWNQGGIPGVGDGTRQVAVFLDNVLNSGRWENYYGPQSQFAPLTGGSLGLGWMLGDHGVTTIDNLKIWDYPKTDFSDRYIEPEPSTAVLLLLGLGLASGRRSRATL